uniref:Uncharacterized protein LOC100183544 n=1 Tax=Phallusia mammillata TaxID=59560 RepID=A0A6F9DHY4_9ASCI|nr:uncharacterized protein LOC100183544 [Phallusia mammillata]
MILLCIGGLLILGIIYLGYQLHQQALYAADLPLDKHVLIVMDNLSFEDHLYAKAGDELARLLKFVVKRVTYSMWQATEISRVGMEAWFAKYAAEVDCVIVICTSCSNLEKLKRSNKEIHFHTEGQLKTHTYIASQATKCNHLSYCSVHFSEKSAPCKFSPTCYTLPQDCASFMKKLSAFTLPSHLQNTAKGRLGYWSKQLSNPQDMGLFTHPKSQETTLIKASSIDPLNIEMEYVCSL